MLSWPSDWTANPCHQTDEAWASFSREPDGQGLGEEAAPGQWWPRTAVEDKDKELNAVSYHCKVLFHDFKALDVVSLELKCVLRGLWWLVWGGDSSVG